MGGFREDGGISGRSPQVPEEKHRAPRLQNKTQGPHLQKTRQPPDASGWRKITNSHTTRVLLASV